jgi:hypothetical protein
MNADSKGTDEATGARAMTVETLRERMGSPFSEEGMRRALSFRPRPTDVLIATYPKSGTTWLQQIVYGLRTRGGMEFDEINAVVPWIEIAFDMGIDLDASPTRAFKTHLAWTDVPKGAKYICVVRNPKDVVVSMYHYFSGSLFEAGSISLQEFASEFFMKRSGGARYWTHVASWWEQRGREDVLLLCYEDIKVNLGETIRAVAKFIDCPLDDALFEIVARQSSFEFMKAHESQFDDHLIRDARNVARGLPVGGPARTRVRSGNVGGHLRELGEDVIRELDAVWHSEIEAKFGFASYEALLRAPRA